jgi:bacterioferritin
MKIDKSEKFIECLNHILEQELAGVIRYTHYALMVYGHNRIPICSWLREQAKESLAHADQIGELITHFEGHPSLKVGKLLETNKHKINDILKESLAHETEGLNRYYELLEMSTGKSIVLEEFARQMIMEEETHIAEVEKMLREPK